MVNTKEDLTGRKFGKLTVVKQVEDYIYPNGKHSAKWQCQCECGSKPTFVVGTCLKAGQIKSCGCSKSQPRPNRRKGNKYQFEDDYIMGFCSNSEDVFYIDYCDYEKIKDLTWHVQKDSDVGAINRLSAYNPLTKKHVRMHVFLGFKNFDHINGNELDNRRNNLRKATTSQNRMNTRNRQIGKSGYRGVQITHNGKYIARIQYTGCDGKVVIHRGHVRNTPEEAYIDYLNLSYKFHGQYSSVLDDIKNFNIDGIKIINEEEFEKMKG